MSSNKGYKSLFHDKSIICPTICIRSSRQIWEEWVQVLSWKSCIFTFSLCCLAMNSVTLLGRVGAEPQKRGSNEHPVVTFSLATHDNYKWVLTLNRWHSNDKSYFYSRYESGDWSQRTDWHRVVVFKPALRDSVLQYLRKGQRTLVTGRISYGEITDVEGQKKIATSIIADDVVFINPQGQAPPQ